ncbi:hypothetical protein M23134_04314 [Microscilla marina ATCC 23134]|uniref:Putative auto-transporter adhesin head GIN domain-containing protein n=2 Tax=Microscilla marina TaxID=1027 RepID=A1ZEH3_MICM2|nr:hypothetical protein M23134_04314 [Microscilla marina ATCC 23134]
MTMKKIFLYTLSLFVLLINHACNPAECLKRTGEIVKEERTVSDFTSILISDNIEVILRNDTIRTITVEAGKNLISSVKTEVKGSILKVTNENTCDWSRSYNTPVKMSIGAKFVQNIEHFGFSKLHTTETLEVNDLNILCKNSGDIDLKIQANRINLFTSSTSYIHLEGSSSTAFLHTNGMGEIFAEKLRVEKLDVLHENINNMHVFPVKSLNVTFNPQNQGNVFYYNEPENIQVGGTGIGKVIKK